MAGSFPVGGPVPPPYGPGYPPPPKPSRAGVWLGSIACVLAAAGLVVGVMALASARYGSAAGQDERGFVAEKIFIPDADKKLCTKIGPLMRPETDRANEFLAIGDPNSSERKAAIPSFKAETLDWANQVQAILKSTWSLRAT
jgi:hypothetical protein